MLRNTMQLLPEDYTRARLALCWPWTSPLQEEKGYVSLSARYHSPTLTCDRAVQSRKNLCEHLRATEEAEKGSLQTRERPTVFAETGEVHVPGSTVQRHCKCCANAAPLREFLSWGWPQVICWSCSSHPLAHISLSTAPTTPMFSFYHSGS